MKTLTFFCLFIYLFTAKSFAQQVVLNLFPSGKTPIRTEYRIIETIDIRPQKSKIGQVTDPSGNKIPVTLKGNLGDLTTRFFSQSIIPTDSAQRIQIRIYDLELKEKYNQAQKLHEGDIKLGIGFFAMGSNEPVHLLDYVGSTQYRRSDFTMDRIEEIVNTLYQNSVDYFDQWYISQNLSNRALAKSIRLEIIEGKEPSTPEKVIYDPKRPLVWADFKDIPSARSKNNATIFTSFSVQGVSLMDSGSVVQTIEINVYMVPGQSWVKVPSDYALNHEQRHFDVVRIVANRMIDRLKKMDLDLDFYQAKINDEYLDAYREMNRLQEFYDKQTQNGINTDEQSKWNLWIDEALAGNWEKIEELLKNNQK